MKFDAEKVRYMTERGVQRPKRWEAREAKRNKQSIRVHAKKNFPKFLKEARQAIRKAAQSGKRTAEVQKIAPIRRNGKRARAKMLVERLGFGFRIDTTFVEAGEGYWSWRV